MRQRPSRETKRRRERDDATSPYLMRQEGGSLVGLVQAHFEGRVEFLVMGERVAHGEVDGQI